MNNQMPSRSDRSIPGKGKAKSIPVGWSSETRFAIPIPHNEKERVAALQSYQILDTPCESEFDDITLMAAQLCNAPMATISFVDRNRQWFKSKIGIDLNETPRDIAFCAHAIMHRDVFILPDASVDPRFARNPMVTGEPRIRFYAGVPLVTENDEALGTLCVLDRVPRNLTTRQKSALIALSRLVLQRLEQRKQAAELDLLRKESARNRKAQFLLESTLDHLEEAICITEARNPKQAVLTCNEAFASMAGSSKEEVCQRPLSSYIQNSFQEIINASERSKNREDGPLRITLTRGDGTSRPVLVQITPYQPQGKGISHYLWRFSDAGKPKKKANRA